MPSVKSIRKGVRKLQVASRVVREANDSGLTKEHLDTLIGLTDPFSGEAAKARYPDQGAGRTMTFQRRSTTTMASDAQGEACLAFNPKSNNIMLGGNVTGTSVGWGSVWLLDTPTDLLSANAYQYRPTSFGIEILCMLSATNCSGYLVVAKAGPPAPNGTTTMDPVNFTSWEGHAVRNGGEYHVTSHPRSGNAYAMKLFADYDGAADPADDTWESVYLYAAGLPASANCFIINIVANYEFTTKEDSSIGQLASPQPIYHPQMQIAVNEVQSTLPASHRNGKAAVSSLIKREGKKALIKHVLPFVARKAKQVLL